MARNTAAAGSRRPTAMRRPGRPFKLEARMRDPLHRLATVVDTATALSD